MTSPAEFFSEENVQRLFAAARLSVPTALARDRVIVSGAMTRRVVFLDIDGVLAPIRQWDRYGDLDPAASGC